MRIRCENYNSDDIKRVYICLANTNEVLGLDVVNPVGRGSRLWPAPLL